MLCNAFDWNRPNNCISNLDTQTPDNVVVPSGVGAYNPLYYAAVGWPTLFLHGNPGIYAMRALSALLSSFFIAVVFYCAAELRGRGGAPVLAATAIACTPMTFYLGGMINPNGLEIACIAALSALSWLIVADRGSAPTTERLVLLGVAVAVGANLRATTALYIVVVLIPPLIALGFDGFRQTFVHKRVLAVALPAAAVSAGGVAWTLFVAAGAGYIPNALSARPNWWGGLNYTIGETWEIFKQEIAVMGWIDALSPTWVYLAWLTLVLILLIAWLRVSRGRGLLAGGIAIAAAFLMPSILQPPITHIYGFIWQGRYSLPLFAAAAIALGFLIARARPESFWRVAVWVVWCLTVAISVVAFLYALRRYAVGNLVSFPRMLDAPVWAPPGGIIGVILLYAAALAALAIVAGVLGREASIVGRYRPLVGGPGSKKPAGDAGR
jgi:hypothetical protein